MTEIQQNRYDRLVRRVTNIVAGGSQVNDTLNELFPVIDVERVPGELLILGGTRLCIGASNLLGDAGETAKIQLFNPVNSGHLITVTTVIATGTVNMTMRWATTTPQLATSAGTQLFRERRLAVTDLPVGQIRQDSTVGFVDANGATPILASVPLILEDSNGVAILPPGSGLTFGNNLVATTIFVTFYWRERNIEPAELNI